LTINLNDIFTPPVAAQLYGLSTDKVKKDCRDGKFPLGFYKKIGGTWVITRAGLRALYGEPKMTIK